MSEYVEANEVAPRRLLVWDAPNIDVALGTLLGGRAPRPEERPRFDTLARWLVGRTEAGEVPEACVFVNVAPEAVEKMRGWVDFLRNAGFWVFARPKTHVDDDIDEQLLEHIRVRASEGPLAEVLLASADQFRDFGESLEGLAEQVPLTVLGFREFNHAAQALATVKFIDLEDIDGLFGVPLVREVPLDLLPPEGAWLPARHSLLELYG